MSEAELESTQFVHVSQIQLRELEQPRRYFDPEALNNLTESIRQYGVLQPLLVRPVLSVSVRYELVAGERRFRAAQTIGLKTVPVVVRHLSDIEAATLALVENLQRQDLNAIEETEGILSLLALHLHLTPEETTSLLNRMAKEVKGQTAQNVLGEAEIETVTTVFDSLGRMSWESFVTSRLPLLNLPQDLQQALQTQALDYTKAIALSRLKDDLQRSILLKQVLAENWSVRRIQAYIKNWRHSEQSKQLSVGLSTKSGDTKTYESDNSSQSSSKAQLSTEPESDETVPWSPIVEPDATADFSSSAEPKSATSQPSQQQLYTLLEQEPLYRQLSLLNQIETISRKVLDLLARRRKPISDTEKQSRLEALLAELNQILVEEW